jgi:hypothetical protein
MHYKRVRIPAFNGVIECLPGTSLGDFYCSQSKDSKLKPEQKGDSCPQPVNRSKELPEQH